MHRLAVLCAVGGIVLLPALRAADQKLTEDDRIEILRGLSSEYATVKIALPRSPKPIPVDTDGAIDKQALIEASQKFPTAARVGDLVEITKVSIESDKIILEINYGAKGKGGHWYDHVQGGMGTTTVPISQPQGTTAPGGTALALVFNKPVPALKAADIKKMLAYVLSFEKETVTENYVEKLPAPIQNAIKQNKAIVGMDRDQVLLAIGRPRHKERNVTKDGTETEDWIYGDPPGKITFITFAGSKVIQVREAYADIGGSTAPPLAVQ